MRTTILPLLALAALGTACGVAADAVDDEPAGSPPAAGMCLEGVPDCVDTVVVPDGEAPDVDEAAVIAEAEALLGVTQAEALADPAVRLSRSGDEHFALTEDYVVGRVTVATDDDGTGTFRVVEVVVELTHGPLVLTDTN